MNAPEPKPVVDKIEASRRQIETAIWLWFHGGDIVSITQLTDSAFGILLDIYHAENWPKPIPFDDTEAAPQGMRHRDWRDKAREAGNFGKHARTDTNFAYEYNPIFAESYLASAISAQNRLEKAASHGLIALFSLWFGAHYPNLVETAPVPTKSVAIDDIRQMSRTEFLKEFGPQFIGNAPRPDYE